ncbi:MAG: hypothetical protein RH859_02630 [Longimicrobiales bacterium]
MKKLLGADVTALACIAGGALVGGVATAALVEAADGPHGAVHAEALDGRCLDTDDAPRVIVAGGEGARIVVAPGVRIGAGSHCVEGRHEVRIHHAIREDRIREVRIRVDRRQVRSEEVRERMEEARVREARAGLEAAERVLDQRLRMLEDEGIEGLDEFRLRIQALDERLASGIEADIDAEVRAAITAEMRALREELDRVRAESRRGGN